MMTTKPPVRTGNGPYLAMYLFPAPEGLPEVDSMRARMVRTLDDATTLSGIPSDELGQLTLSLAMALTRAEYHEARFAGIIASLEERRGWFASPTTADRIAVYAVYEAAAALGAARLLVDEALHITARRNKEPDGKNLEKRWAASKVMDDVFFADSKNSYIVVDETKLLRAAPHRGWYELLNDYRNVLFHRGWREPFGIYYPRDYGGPKPKPQVNALLVPDRSSIKEKAKQKDWTYTSNARLEDIVETSMNGLRVFVDALCHGVWGGVVPPRGTDDGFFNMIVPLPAPMPYGSPDGNAVLPLFSTEAKAHDFKNSKLVTGLSETTLQRLPLDELRQHFMFSLSHVPNLDPAPRNLEMIIDPILGMTHLSGGIRQDVVLGGHDARVDAGYVPKSLVPHAHALWCLGVPLND